jgi:hypothetical protein
MLLFIPDASNFPELFFESGGHQACGVDVYGPRCAG